MANRDKRAKKEDNQKELFGVLLLALALFLFLALAGLSMGTLGAFAVKFLSYFLGRTAVLLPLALLGLGFCYIVRHRGLPLNKRFFSCLLLVACFLGLFHNFFAPLNEELLPENITAGAGVVGGFVLLFLRRIAGVPGALLILGTGVVCALLLTGKFSLQQSVAKTENGMKNAKESLRQTTERFLDKRMFYDQEKETDRNKSAAAEHDEVPVFEAPDTPPPPPFREKTKIPESAQPAVAAAQVTEGYNYPPFSLLNPLPRRRSESITEDIREQGRVLETTLADFNVRVEVVNITCGPSVTRFEVQPAPGVKVSRIVNLADDLALNLAAPGIRIEPVPGKAAIGIEVPNLKNEMVPLRAVLDCEVMKKAEGKLSVALGKDIAGNVIAADLGKMPHLLVAGSTGSGKSVCINTIIASLLFRASPEEVRLILVDPKVVELTNYNGIPHLLTPVVTNAKQAASALHWAVVEMERRYELFAASQVREINRYNELAGEKLPYIVIIIDELADLMMVAAVDVEDAILRLAQKARAAGIHLILATQRPSVDVITGVIKANIPSRIAFAVSSQTDSRTILDLGGAEKLLGKGDMLYYPMGANRPQRLQGAFVTDNELQKLVDYIKLQALPTEYSDEVTTQQLESDAKRNSLFADEESAMDELFPDAVRLAMDTGQSSSSMLQRKFRIGYTRAARLVDTMEELGIVSPAMGSKPRELIMSKADIENRFFNKNK